MIVSIIIATGGSRAITQRAVRSVLNQDFPADQFEVILVLDGCEQPVWCAEERARARCHFHVERAPKRGQAACINTGLKIATGEIALFLDDDILCPPDLIAKHVQAHTQSPGHLAFGPIVTSEESRDGLVTEWTRRRNDTWFQQATEQELETGWCFSFANPNTSAPRELLVSAGALDESFWRYNDTELGFRLCKQGLRFTFIRDADVTHVVDESLSDLAVKRAYEEGRAEVQLCRKHPEYRKLTLLGGISEGRNLRIVARRFLVAACRAANAFLAPATALADKFRRFRPVRNLGLRMISWRYLANYFRGAIDECGGWNNFRAQFAMRLPVFCYHRVGQPQRGEWHALSIARKAFERHLRWLQEHEWTTITSEQWSAWLDRGAPLPEKPILLTFDDGFAENVESAFPQLTKYGFVALTAVVTARLADVNRWDIENAYPEFQLMTPGDTRAWASSGMEFASHSHTHAHLQKLSDCELNGELSCSADELHAIIGKDVHSFVYPYGEYDRRVSNLVSPRYRLAFTLNPGLNSIATPRHEQRRIVISKSDSSLDLWFYTTFGRSPVAELRRALLRDKTE